MSLECLLHQRMMDNHSSPTAAEPVRRRVNTRTPGKKTMRWDTEADQQLLLAILAAHEVKIDFEAVASRLGEHCTPRAVVERLKKLKKQAIGQDHSDQSTQMTKAPPVKKTKRVVPGENTSSTDKSSAANGVEKSTQAQVSASSTVSAANDFKEVYSTEEPSIRRMSAGDSVEKKSSSSGRGLLPVKHKQAVGTSHAQPVISPGQMLLEERSRDKLHEVHVFSSQKMPQPFLDR